MPFMKETSGTSGGRNVSTGECVAILFIHVEADDDILRYHSVRLRDAEPAHSTLWLVPRRSIRVRLRRLRSSLGRVLGGLAGATGRCRSADHRVNRSLL